MINLKRCLGSPLENGDEQLIAERIFQYTKRYYRLFYLLVLASQIIMLVMISLRPGGPFAKPRRVGYVCCYLSLAAASAVMLAVRLRMEKKGEEAHRKLHKMEIGFLFFLCYWGTAVTLNDQLGGNGLNVFIYMTLIASAGAIIKPWQSLLVFGSNFLLLNGLLPFFPSPYGADQTFNNLMNSFFISCLSFAISASFYRGRIMAEYNKIVIERQYKEIEKMNRRLSKEVLTDDLTGIYNRRYLEKEIMEFDVRSRNERGAACMMIDVDYFKLFNDTYGHQAGDLCLKEIAGFLADAAAARGGHTIRYGGEEFMMFLFGPEAKNAVSSAETLRQEWDDGNYLDRAGLLGHVTLSIGIYKECPAVKNEIEQFIFRADQALYSAKKKGRNCVVEFGSETA